MISSLDLNISSLNFYEKLGLARAGGLTTLNDLRAILHLAEFGPMHTTALAPICRISTAAVTGLVQKLTDAGYVERSFTKGDRRKIMVELTQAGKELASDLNL